MSTFNQKGGFARNLLEKQGWSFGQGLGVQGQGISSAIKVKVKQDTAGVGHDSSKDFTDHWWDMAYNKAAASISVEDGESGVTVKKKKKKEKKTKAAVKNSLYSSFVKGSLLSDGSEVAVARERQNDSEEEAIATTDTLKLPSDELLKICGGRTAHKGARHGLQQNGKLARIEQQERRIKERRESLQKHSPSDTNLSLHNSPHTDDAPLNNGSVKKRKQKCDVDQDTLPADGNQQNGSSSSPIDETVSVNDGKKKKKKRKRKDSEQKVVNLECEASVEVDCVSVAESEKSRKKKKKRRNKEKDNEQTSDCNLDPDKDELSKGSFASDNVRVQNSAESSSSGSVGDCDVQKCRDDAKSDRNDIMSEDQSLVNKERKKKKRRKERKTA